MKIKLMFGKKDGGPESKVHMYGVESKRFGSILLLRFGADSRDAYHTHAFDCVSIVLRGWLQEHFLGSDGRVTGFRDLTRRYGWFPTYRTTLHRVLGMTETSWVLTIRGPWFKTWREYTARRGFVTLTHGRKEVA